MKRKIGDVIYYSKYERGKGYGGLYKSEITKVGRKYFQTSDSSKEIPIDGMMSGDRADPHKKYFLSEQDFFDWKESILLREKIVRYFYNMPKLSLEKLKQIDSIIS